MFHDVPPVSHSCELGLPKCPSNGSKFPPYLRWVADALSEIPFPKKSFHSRLVRKSLSKKTCNCVENGAQWDAQMSQI